MVSIAEANLQPSLDKSGSHSYDILIIGGGLAGLVAAHKIATKQTGLRFAVIEASPRCGGQIQSSAEGELGARWIAHNQPHIVALCEELGVELRPRPPPDPDRQRGWLVDRVWYAPLARFELQRFVRYVDLLAADYGPGRMMADRSERTAEGFLCDQLFFEVARDMVRLLVRSMSGCEAGEVAFGEFMALCHSSAGLSAQLENLTGTGANIQLIKPNFQSLVDQLTKAIGTERILLQTRVTRVYQYKNRVELLSNSGTPKLTAKIVILAVPMQDEQRIAIFPSGQQQPTSRRPHFVSTFNALFMNAFWRRAGHSGSFVFRQAGGPYIVTFEDGPNTLSGCVYHDNDQPDYRPLDDVLEHLRNQFDCDELQFSAELHTWPQTIYRGFAGSGLTDGNRRLLRASANCGHQFRGCCNGAVQAGNRGAVLALMRVKRELVDASDLGVDAGRLAANSSGQRRYGRVGVVERSLAACNLYNCGRTAVLLPLVVGAIWLAVRRIDVHGNGVRMGVKYRVSYS